MSPAGISLPSLNQVRVGGGRPVAWQLKVAVSPSVTSTVWMDTMNLGGTGSGSSSMGLGLAEKDKKLSYYFPHYGYIYVEFFVNINHIYNKILHFIL